MLHFRSSRRRSLTRHAIETGIIERLYDLDWGVTRALVAEGLTADAVARIPDGTVSYSTLTVIRIQYEALEFLSDVAREGRELSTSLIKEIHVALTRNQRTYTATSPAGLVFEATLHHGEWKQRDDHVIRPDGSVLEHTPYEQVPPQMERLVELYRSYRDVNPIVREAWLHHCFVWIHPFEDGNGRVARCLTYLGLLRDGLAPLVVDRRERSRYLRCLDEANDGDLRPLVRFFAELELVALRSELERPEPASEMVAAGRGAVSVLDASINRLQALRVASGAAERAQLVAKLGDSIHDKIHNWLEQVSRTLDTRLRALDAQAYASVQSHRPPDPEARYWHRQLVTAANSVDFFANLQNGAWWSRLYLGALGQRLRYLVFLQKVGRGETGVLAMTVYAELLDDQRDTESSPEPTPVVVSAPTDTVTWTYTESADARWDMVEEILDRTLASAVAEFTASIA